MQLLKAAFNTMTRPFLTTSCTITTQHFYNNVSAVTTVKTDMIVKAIKSNSYIPQRTCVTNTYMLADYIPVFISVLLTYALKQMNANPQHTHT